MVIEAREINDKTQAAYLNCDQKKSIPNLGGNNSYKGDKIKRKKKMLSMQNSR